MSEGDILFPGDRLATEEEFVPSKNVYIEKGNIYSYAVGEPAQGEGKIGIKNAYREIRKITRGMPVLGTVVGSLPAVVFLKIDNFRSGKVVQVPIKDGKIVMKSERRGPPMRGRPMRDSRDGRDGRDSRDSMREFRPCDLGDVVLALVYRDDEDNYELSLRDRENGVVFCKCEECGAPLLNPAKDNTLACPNCKTTKSKKVSSLYGDAEAIKRYMTKDD